MPLAMAKHILLKDRASAEALLKELNQGADFSKLAQKHSLCPSKKRGGDLGEIRKGDLVPSVDKVIFTMPIKTLHGPIKSKFGFHIIWVYFRQA